MPSPRPALAQPPREYHPVEPEGPQRRHHRHRWWATAGTLAVLAFAAVLLAVLRGHSTPRTTHDRAADSLVLDSEAGGRSTADAWHHHEGLKCFPGHGGKSLESKHADDRFTLEECQKACLDTEGCQAVMMVQGWSPGPCHFREQIELDECQKKTVWGLWTVPGFEHGPVEKDDEEEEPEKEKLTKREADDDERFLEAPKGSAAKGGGTTTDGGSSEPPAPATTRSPLQEFSDVAASEDAGSQSFFAVLATEIDDTKNWEVVGEPGAEIWSDRDAASSKVVGTLPKCSMFTGKRRSSVSNPTSLDWVERWDGPGFVRIHARGVQLVQEVEVEYMKVHNGTCESAGLWPIVNDHQCGLAAVSLGLASNVSDVQADEDKELVHRSNCYHLRRSGKLIVTSTDRASEIAEKLTMICSTTETCFGTTTTTTTTRTSTTKTTTTKTTSTTTTSWGYPSVFCWSVVTPWGYEPGLVAAQYDRGAGIFNCDNYAVLSGSGDLKVGPLDVIQIPETDGGAGMGNLGEQGVTTNSFLNTGIFLHAWVVLVEETDALKYDWIAKVDPDAVFFPERLRWHLEQHMGDNDENVYFMNCNRRFGPNDPEGAKLFGSLEIFSKGAVAAYHDNADRCMNELNWHGWGEDYFMSHCMDHIGIGRVEDFWMLADNRCNGAPCDDTSKVSYHDFKDEGAWFWCWETSLGDDGVKEYADRKELRQNEQRKLLEAGDDEELRQMHHVSPKRLLRSGVLGELHMNNTDKNKRKKSK